MSNEGGYSYTQDWFHWAPEVWTQLIPLLPSRKRFLEIGSYEGRSTVWTVENMIEPGGEIHCIDTWEGGEEHDDVSGVEGRFDRNIRRLSEAHPSIDFVKGKTTSLLGLTHYLGLRTYHGAFDFIYIDGSHVARDVLTDACMAWPLLAQGGILVFDDYMWGEPRDILHRPKIAVDSFLNVFAEQVEVVHVGYQMVIRKKEGVQ